MKRKLWLLNFALIAVVAAGGWRLRKEAQDFHQRERSTFGTRVPIPAPPPPPPAAPSPAVKAASYLEIADKMLWSRDRNSQVIPDLKPPEKPKPLPPLPSVYGVMHLDGPIVMMSEKSGARQRGIRPGEKIGEFKLDAVNGEQLVFSWEDRKVTKKLDELIDRGVDSTPVVNASGPAAASASSTPAAPQVVGRPEPGVKLSEGINSCQTNDPAPAGTVVNGMRKVERVTPFGKTCYWEAVK